jgi:hypothetical protein
MTCGKPDTVLGGPGRIVCRQLRDGSCNAWPLQCEPPEKRLPLEAHDAAEAGRGHRGFLLCPPENCPLVHLQHVRDLLRGEEHGHPGGTHI